MKRKVKWNCFKFKNVDFHIENYCHCYGAVCSFINTKAEEKQPRDSVGNEWTHVSIIDYVELVSGQHSILLVFPTFATSPSVLSTRWTFLQSTHAHTHPHRSNTIKRPYIRAEFVYIKIIYVCAIKLLYIQF